MRNIIRKGAGADTGNAGHFASVTYTNSLGTDADLGGVNIDELDIDSLAEASEEELDQYVYHDDWRVRIYACTGQLSTRQIDELTNPATQPIAVRMAAAALTNPGVAHRAAQDPCPTVRHRAWRHGWDLDESTRDRLGADPEVRKVDALIGPVLA